jgi:fructose-specific phosphotransferase system IIC component
MREEDKLVINFTLVFGIVLGIIGFVIGIFLDFPGANFIMFFSLLIFGAFLGFIIGTIVKFVKISKKDKRYKI